MRIIRNSIFVILSSLTVWFIFGAVTTTPDPHYGQAGAVMLYGLLAFLVWIPYCIACMFVDKNKRLGLVSIVVVILTLGSLGLAITFENFGMHVLALLLCPVSLVAIWVLSIISFVEKKKTQNKNRQIQ